MPIDNKTLLRVRSIVGAGGGGEGGEAVIRSLSVTENGTYTAPSGVDGYSPVTVNVPQPSGTKTITSNGTHDVAAYASAQVNVPDTPAVTEALTVTENGTYTPDSGVDGFDSVTVNVAGSGSGDDGSFKAVIERTATDITLPSDLTSIGSYAFYSCTNLALTSLPSDLKRIMISAFQNCTNLALTSLPSGITSIMSSTFQNCTGLSTITFEGTPTSISSSAFSGCTNLATINVPWAEGAVANAPWGATNATINYNYTGE